MVDTTCLLRFNGFFFQDVGVLSWTVGTEKITSPRSLTASLCVLQSSLKYVRVPFFLIALGLSPILIQN